MKKRKINISKMIFKVWDKHTEMCCKIAIILIIPSTLSRVFATVCSLFGLILLTVVRTGYEKHWNSEK